MNDQSPIWPQEEPTNPRGERPQGPPPASPPPAQPPTALPPQWNPAPPPPAGPPPAAGGFPPYGPPPGFGGPGGPGGPGGYGGGFGGPPPPRKSRVGLIIGSLLALVLVIGLAVSGFLYFTGRFGIGPLSAADKDAAKAIADGVEKPAWASDGDVDCAVDELVHEHRSGELEERGLVDRSGDDFSYTGEWRSDDANAYYESLLDCTGDWAKQVGAEWKLDDTGCLDDIGTTTMAAWFAQDALTLGDGKDAAEEDRTKAVEALDKCYLKTPPAPEATPAAGYRSVKFTFADTSAEGDVTINTGGAGSWTPLTGPSVSIETEEGGARGCVDAQAVTTYPWGSTAEAEEQFCGTAKPKRIWWKKKARCTIEPGCYSYVLHYEGFKDYSSLTASYTSNGGDCLATSGRCSDTVSVGAGGRGTVVTWSFPGSYRGNFVARVGNLKSKLPN